MAYTIKKSTSGAYFEVTDSNDGITRPYTVQDYELDPNTDGVSFSVYSKYYPSKRIIRDAIATTVINGDTTTAFANYVAFYTYFTTNCYR